jgi:hypothetical protein
MPLAVKLSLLAAGLFLLSGMLTGVWKYSKIMSSKEHRAPVYVDIAHRTSFFYSFASLVIAALANFSPYPEFWQIAFVAVPLIYFAVTVIGYIREGYVNRTENIFRERNFVTTWFVYSLIAGEIVGFSFVLGGFIYTQFFAK